jgi:hypothetical protein
MKTFFQLREEKTQVTVGDYTTKHFDMCPSAVKLYSNIKNMTPMVHLVVENMMLHDLFFRLEKQAVAQGSIDMDDLEKADEYAEMIMDNAEQMGLEEEHSYIEDVHMAKFEQLAGMSDDEEDDSEEDMNEKTLTPAELKKRKEVADAIKRENPNMPMAKKMAIATATAKKVAEGLEDVASMGNRSLARIAGTVGHPLSAAAKSELARRRTRNEEAIERAAEYLVNENIDVDDLSEEQINELLGSIVKGAAKLAYKGAKAAVVNRKGNFRFSTAGRADAAETQAKKLEKANKDRERLRTSQERIRKAQARRQNEATLHLDVNKASNDELKQYVKKSSTTIARSSSVHPDVMHTHDAAQKELKKRQKMQEEAEQVDEISRDLARRYIRKVADKTNTGELNTKQVMKRRPGVNLAGKKAYPGVAGEPRVRATESVTLDELSRKALGSYIKKANVSAMDQARKSGEYNNPDQPKHFSKAMDRMRGIKKATDKLVAKEEVEQLDELSPNTLSSYASKANIDASKARSHMRVSAGGNSFAIHKKRYDKRTAGAVRAGEKYRKLLAREETENLDELSKKTLGTYVKKATGSAVGLGAITTAQAMSSKGKADPDDKRQLRNRMTGVSRATDRLTKEETDLNEISRDLATRAAQGFADKADAAHNKKDYAGFKKGEAARKMAIAKVQGRAKVSAVARRVEETNLDEVSSSTLLRYSVKSAMQGGGAKGDKRIAGQKMADEKLRKKHGNSSTARVAAGPARRESVEIDESDAHRVRDDLKSEGKFKEAGEHAYKHGLGRSYGPHFGMRSSKNSAEMEYHKGYDHAQARESRAARLKKDN